MDEPKEDIQQLTLQIRSLREQLEEFETECQQKFNEQMCTLEGLLTWCDHLLAESCALCGQRAGKKEIPEGP